MLITASVLFWQIYLHQIWIGYPSDGLVEQVCIGEYTCWVPKDHRHEVIDWDGDVPYVMAWVRLPDGTLRYDTAVPVLPEGEDRL